MDDPVLSRRSIRKYTDEPVDDATVERLLRAGMTAPSAGNQQPWQFIVIRDRATLAGITEWHPYARMLPSAPVAVLVLGDPRGAKWQGMWPQDCAACVENMLIEAELLGLGAVWLGVHPLPEREAALREQLGIPEQVVPFAIIPFGRPLERKEPSDRYDEARVHHERW
jgi:nitroreductase